MARTIFFILIISQLIIVGCRPANNGKVDMSFEEKINNLVLGEKRIGEEFFFKVPTSKGVLEYKVKYIGSLKNSQGDSLSFLSNIVYSGSYEETKRAGSTVNIYDQNNAKKGYYYVGGAKDGPQKVQGDSLIFSFDNETCDQRTAISFRDSIPSQIYIACIKDGGDLYTLQKE